MTSANEQGGASEHTSGAVPGEIAALSYEEALGQLREVVVALEQGGVTLEESLALWERGEHLAAACLARLDGAKARLEDAMASTESAEADD